MSRASRCRVGNAVFAVIWCVSCMVAEAALTNVTTNDNYTKIESASPGDEVVIAPGTYSFRVYLTKQAGVTNPIIIRALDPANPPVWDFGNTLVETAPNSRLVRSRALPFYSANDMNFSGLRTVDYRV